jgi:hypothetical protein
MLAGAVEQTTAISRPQRPTDDHRGDDSSARELQGGCGALQPRAGGVGVVNEQQVQTGHVLDRLEGGIAGHAVRNAAGPAPQRIDRGIAGGSQG